MKEKGKIRHGLAYQIFTFFVLSLLITDIISFYVIRNMVTSNVMAERETIAHGVAKDVDSSIQEYESYAWVIIYLFDHEHDDFDFEYDKTDETVEKTAEFLKDNPGFDIKNATPDDLNALSPEDQQKYVEIVYNAWIMRFNELKAAYNAEYIYILATDDNFDEDIFLVNSNGGTNERGTELGQSYIFGVRVTNNPDQKETFSGLKPEVDETVYTTGYMDSYHYNFKLNGMNVLTGMTFTTTDIQSHVKNQTIKFMIAFVLLQTLFIIFCRFMLYKYVIKPVLGITNSVKQYTKDKDGESVKKSLEQIHPDNEIGSLSTGIYEMVCEIEDHVEEIKNVTAEKERISVELDLAQKIQADMLPSIFPPFPEQNQFDIYATTDPAKEVGGDFYDFFMVDDDHVALVMADVSGKGVPASLFMVVAKTLIKNYAMMKLPTSEVLTRVNKQLMEGNDEGMFVTVWIAIIDIHTGEGIASNAGHEHPVLRHKDGSFELIKYRHSMAVAMMPGVPFEQHEIKVLPGDRIFVYTDGLPESRNSDKVFFGTDRMLETLNRDPDATGQQVLKNLIDDMNAFVGDAEQFDDVTMLIFDYYGNDNEK